MKKILYLIPRFTTGGAEKLVFEYCRYFQQAGFEVAVASVVGGGELESEFNNLGISTFVGSKNKMFSTYRGLKKFIKEFSPDIIHSNVFSADVVGFLFSASRQWLSTQHNVGDEYSFWRKIVLRFVLRFARVIAVSDSVKDFCIQKLGIKNSQIKIIKNGAQLKPFFESENTLFSVQYLRLASIGRIEKQKNHEFLLDILSELHIPFDLKIFGAGSLQSDLSKKIKKLNLDKKIKFMGNSANLARDLANVDVVLQPSLWEGRSLVIMESMASAKIILASPQAGADLIEDDETGFVLQLDKNIWQKKIKQIWQEKNKEIGQKAREYAKNNFSIEQNLEELRKFYEGGK